MGGSGDVGYDLWTRYAINNDARLVLDFILRQAAEGFNRGFPVACQVVGEISGLPKKMVVLVQPVRNSAEAAQAFEPANDGRFDGVAGSIEFVRGGPVF